MEASSPPLLHQMRFSHFNEKGRWALDYKGVPHRRRSYPPGVHAIASRRLGGSGTMPILEFDDRRVTDSAEIVAELERIAPEPPLYPDGEAARAEALELERFFGAELGPGVRAALFFELLKSGRATRDATLEGFGRGTRAVNAAAFPVTRIMVRRGLGADRGGAERGREQTIEAMDRIESLAGRDGYLVGDRFSVADLAGAALMAPLVGPPGFAYATPDPWPAGWEEFRTELRGRDAWAWTEEMYARHRGSSAEVA
jgi:glutathione S-transferase